MALNKESMLSAEYTSLRTEILQRISTRYTLINFSLLAFAAMLGFQKVVLILLYPIIACFLFGMYRSNERAIRYCTEYIAQYIELFVRHTDMQTQSQNQPPSRGYIGWYHFRTSTMKPFFLNKYVGWMRFREPSTMTFSLNKFEFAWGRFLFVATEIVAIGAAWSMQKPDFPPHLLTALNVLYLVALVFILITLILVILRGYS